MKIEQIDTPTSLIVIGETFTEDQVKADEFFSVNAYSHPKRRIEKWATMQLLSFLGIPIANIGYTDYGKPYLIDGSQNISISHSAPFVVVALSPNPIGVDIQRVVDKVERVRKRFVRLDEEAFIPPSSLEHLSLLWAAKEAAFKCIDERGVDAIKHLRIKPFQLKKSGEVIVEEYRTEKHKQLVGYYEVRKDVVWVVVHDLGYEVPKK